MNPTNKPAAIVAVRCCDMQFPARGAERANCSKCLTPVWVAPSSRKLMEARGIMPLYCIQCVPKNESVKLRVAPGAVEEFIADRRERRREKGN